MYVRIHRPSPGGARLNTDDTILGCPSGAGSDGLSREGLSFRVHILGEVDEKGDYLAQSIGHDARDSPVLHLDVKLF